MAVAAATVVDSWSLH